MRGLVYKDFNLFFKSIDKKLIFVAVAAVALLMVSAENFSGFLAAIMFAATIGIQNTMSFACDEQVNWKKYQLTMPVSAGCVVGSKYLSVLMTAGISAAAGAVLYLISTAIYGGFDTDILFATVAVSVIVPVVWTAICLPLTYWLGFKSAQAVRLLVILPIFYLITYFEDGPGFTELANTLSSYLFAGFAVSCGLFIVSYFISIPGYARKK